MADETEVGFCRPEMGSESLAGSAKLSFGRHLFLVWGRAADWPEKVPEECPEGSTPRLLEAALAEAKVKKVKWNLIEAGPGDREGDVLVFPEYARFRSGESGFAALTAFLSGPKLQAGLPPASGGDVEDLAGAFAFICAHAHRDARCGHCGPRLQEALEAQRSEGLHLDFQVRKCSHVGGHKYAGNVIVFSGKSAALPSHGDGHWYGYVTPGNLPAVLSGRAICGPLWRGRMGVPEEGAKKERRAKVVREAVPLALLALGGAALAGALLWRCIGGARRRSE
mmetsp:Transcript_11578/g.24401  ORF Transcript_11578/g.24401 Transcript_11578/m.24401 type:complete len:281 (-) Transcript_11578:25-867(-)